MSDAIAPDPTGELPFFFGADEAQSTDELAPEIWSQIDD